MSEDQCSICFERLGSDKIAALPCRHVYHHTCILHWMRTSRNGIMPCPICKHATNRHGIVGPLYIDCLRIERKKNNSRDQPIVIDDAGRDNTTSGGGGVTSSSDSDTETHRSSNAELESLQMRLHQAEEKASQLAARNMQLEDRNRNLLRIKKVADLDVNMGWTGSSSQMDQMRGLPHDELIVAFEALRARCSRTEMHSRNLEDIARLAQQRYQNLVSEKEFFERKFNKLNAKLEMKKRKEKRQQAESMNHADRTKNHQRGVPNAPVILYRRTEIAASPSGNSGLSTDKERGSVSNNGDSSDTSDEIDPVSSKRSGKRPMASKKRRLSDYLHQSRSSTHDTSIKEPIDNTTSVVWGAEPTDIEDYGLTVVEPRSSSSRYRDPSNSRHLFPSTNSATNGHRGHVIDLTDD